jgi:ribosomal protein S18 acetylase RimI-like enzyme
MRIDDYRSEDARAVVQLWRTSFEHALGIKDHHPLQDQLEHFLTEVVPHYEIRVAREDPTIIAFIAFTSESIGHLYVRVQCIGRGVGTRLLGLAKEASCGSLWLYTFARNGNARRFYERHGFREIERESENMWKLEAIKYRWVKLEGAA